MHARQWFPGLVGAGALSALALAPGCGSSSSNGRSADAAAGDASDAACMPRPVIVPDSGPCGVCLTSMCASALMACTADCTCGGTVDMVARCLAGLPPPSTDAGGGLGFLGPAAQLALCVLGGGGAGGGAGANTATTSYIACLGSSCSSECLGVSLGDGGMDAAAPAESGPPEGGPMPEAGSDGGGIDAAPEAAIEAGPVDAPSEAAPDASDAGLAAETSDN